MKKRLEYFDVAKGIGVFLVLVGHLQGDDVFQYSPYILPFCEWIFSFHMPFFFIISGMLISYRNDMSKDMKDIAKRRFKGIMIPYYWFSFFYMTVVIAAYFNKQIIFQNVILNVWYVLSCYGMNVLWFLPAAFFGELLFIFIMKKLDTKKAVAVIALQCVVALVLAYLLRQGTYDTTIKEGAKELATTVLRPFIVCSFTAIGYFGFTLINSIDKREATDEKPSISVKELLIGVALMVVGALLVRINHGVDFRSLVFKNVPAYYVCSLATSFGLILICKNIKPFKLLKFWGVNSLIFMAAHASQKAISFAIQAAMWCNQFLTRARGYICYAIIISIVALYTSIMIILINKFVPFIAGKPFKGFKKASN